LGLKKREDGGFHTGAGILCDFRNLSIIAKSHCWIGMALETNEARKCFRMNRSQDIHTIGKLMSRIHRFRRRIAVGCQTEQDGATLGAVRLRAVLFFPRPKKEEGAHWGGHGQSRAKFL
jgi:hypothetical protein